MKVNIPKMVAFLIIVCALCTLFFMLGFQVERFKMIKQYETLYEEYKSSDHVSTRVVTLLGQCMGDYEKLTGKEYQSRYPNPWKL